MNWKKVAPLEEKHEALQVLLAQTDLFTECVWTMSEPDSEMKHDISTKPEGDGAGPLIFSDPGSAKERCEVNPENFVAVARGHMESLLKKHGGPCQYLQHRYGSSEALQEFVSNLDAEFPALPTVCYHSGQVLPRDADQTFALRLQDLGFGDRCSSKPLPFMTTSMQLVDEYLTNTFLSRSALAPLIIFISQGADKCL